ncbi:hypothetical protein [Yoonia sp. BS5-3]|uniref:Uncharacterized protein n=1 Tax=Yoonia phaeophyticola TaxID=3137369 RepID=A0ABZ2V1M9_9RHOB
MRSALIAITLTTPLAAQDALSAADFEAYAQGKTLGYRRQSNTFYGTERYMQNRRVLWTTIDGRCTTGVWYESKGQICFRYDDDATPTCWQFHTESENLIGYFDNNLTSTYNIDIIDEKELFPCDQLTS